MEDLFDEEQTRQVAYFPTELSKEGNRLRNKLIDNIRLPYVNKKNRISGGKLDYENVVNMAKGKIDEDELKAIYAEYEMTYNQLANSVNEYNKNPPPPKEKELTDEEKFKKKLDKLIVFDASYGNCESQTGFEKIVKSWPGLKSKTIEEWYDIYFNGIHSSPGWYINTSHSNKDISYTVYKSPNKRAKLAERLGLNLTKEEIYNEFDENEEISKSFPKKENKQYYLHKVWQPNSYIVDLMQSGKFIYLIAININTRYAYAKVMNREFSGNNGVTKYGTDRLKSATDYLRCLKSMIRSNEEIDDPDYKNMKSVIPMRVQYLTGDAEKAFGSEEAQSFYASHNIIWIECKRLRKGVYDNFYYNDPNQAPYVKRNQFRTDPMHSSLAIIDRFIRTLRDMAYNAEIGVIEPKDMKVLLELYNNAPHKTLSYYAGRETTPKEVQLKPELEKWIIRRVCQENFNIKKRDGFHINVNDPVKVYNEKDLLQKRRTLIQPGLYYVAGFEDGYYVIYNPDNLDDVQDMPRYRIAPAYVRKYRIT